MSKPYTGDNPELKQKKTSARDQYIEDFKWLMSTERGRRLMWVWLGETNLYATSVKGNSATLTYFNEGMRSIGLNRMADIHTICPEEYLQMVKEAQK